jgi:hypothetical protein
MANAFSALGRVDFINLFAQINGLVRALGLTHIAVDAFIGDHQCHATSSTQVSVKFMARLSATHNTPRTGRAAQVGRPLLRGKIHPASNA